MWRTWLKALSELLSWLYAEIDPAECEYVPDRSVRGSWTVDKWNGTDGDVTHPDMNCPGSRTVSILSSPDNECLVKDVRRRRSVCRTASSAWNEWRHMSPGVLSPWQFEEEPCGGLGGVLQCPLLYRLSDPVRKCGIKLLPSQNCLSFWNVMPRGASSPRVFTMCAVLENRQAMCRFGIRCGWAPYRLEFPRTLPL